MAKAKQPAKTAEPTPESPAIRPGVRQRNILSLKGSDEWKAWLDKMATAEGMPVTVLVDQAIREFAKARGHASPPSRV